MPGRQCRALRSASGDLAVLYFASGGQVTLDHSKLAEPLRAEWYNPRDGSRRGANPSSPTRIVLLTKKTGCCCFANREMVVRIGSSIARLGRST